MIAYCWAGGVIQFGRKVPEGAIEMARGPAKKLRATIEVTARLAYDGKTLLVPGVPEAPDQDSACDALMHHLDWLRSRQPRRIVLREIEIARIKPRRVPA